MNINSALFKGEEKPDGFAGYIADGNIFCILEAGEGYTKEEGHNAIRLLKDICIKYSENPTVVDQHIRELIREGNLPVRVSLALGIVGSGELHLKTLGDGQVWLRRGTDFVNLIKGNHSAAGPTKPEDTFVFTTNTFINTIAAPAALTSFIENPSLSDGVEELNLFMKNKGRAEGIALFARISSAKVHEEHMAVVPATAEIEKDEPVQKPSKKFLHVPKLPDMNALLQTNKKKKIVTFGFVFIILCILIWSVGFGYKRRQTAQALERIKHSREIVTQKLNQSDEVAFLNPQRSLVLINEANSEVASLRKEIGSDYQKEVDELAAMVKQREDQITHKENKKADEFFDLSIDNKNANGSKMFLDGDQLAVLDTKNGYIYKLSIEKKSLDKVSASEVKSASLLVQYEDTIYFFVQGKGLYKFNDAGKAVKVIDADDELGSVADISVYNGNLYFLAPTKNKIYKYVPTENGFSEKSVYTKSESSVLRQTSSIAIDSSVYAASTDTILKYTAGVEDEFKTVFPEEGVHIYKVITNADLEKVYAWDRANGVLYILAKNGTYERQVRSSSFAKADDVAVFGNTAYTLENKKIYSISIE